MFFNPKTLRWEGNEQIFRDVDPVVASSSRPALITNPSGQAPSTLVNGQSSATAPKVVGSMLFDLSRCAGSTSWAMHWRRTRSRPSTSWRRSMKRKEKDGGPSSEPSALRAWGERRECLWSGSAPADRPQPGEELRAHESKYTLYPVWIGARERWGLRSWIEDVLARRTRAIDRWRC